MLRQSRLGLLPLALVWLPVLLLHSTSAQDCGQLTTGTQSTPALGFEAEACSILAANGDGAVEIQCVGNGDDALAKPLSAAEFTVVKGDWVASICSAITSAVPDCNYNSLRCIGSSPPAYSLFCSSQILDPTLEPITTPITTPDTTADITPEEDPDEKEFNNPDWTDCALAEHAVNTLVALEGEDAGGQVLTDDEIDTVVQEAWFWSVLGLVQVGKISNAVVKEFLDASKDIIIAQLGWFLSSGSPERIYETFAQQCPGMPPPKKRACFARAALKRLAAEQLSVCSTWEQSFLTVPGGTALGALLGIGGGTAAGAAVGGAGGAAVGGASTGGVGTGPGAVAGGGVGAAGGAAGGAVVGAGTGLAVSLIVAARAKLDCYKLECLDDALYDLDVRTQLFDFVSPIPSSWTAKQKARNLLNDLAVAEANFQPGDELLQQVDTIAQFLQSAPDVCVPMGVLASGENEVLGTTRADDICASLKENDISTLRCDGFLNALKNPLLCQAVRSIAGDLATSCRAVTCIPFEEEVVLVLHEGEV